MLRGTCALCKHDKCHVQLTLYVVGVFSILSECPTGLRQTTQTASVEELALPASSRTLVHSQPWATVCNFGNLERSSSCNRSYNIRAIIWSQLYFRWGNWRTLASLCRSYASCLAHFHLRIRFAGVVEIFVLQFLSWNNRVLVCFLILVAFRIQFSVCSLAHRLGGILQPVTYSASAGVGLGAELGISLRGVTESARNTFDVSDRILFRVLGRDSRYQTKGIGFARWLRSQLDVAHGPGR